MATRSHIGVKQPNGTIDYIYCHFDGYPEHNGDILVNYYQDIDKVNQLINLGNLSMLGEEIGEQQDFDNRETHNKKWCLAYGRDRGETNIEKRNTTFDDLLRNDNVSYLYVFDNDKWIGHNVHNKNEINLYKTQLVQS
jgi:hypothetical protein